MCDVVVCVPAGGRLGAVPPPGEPIFAARRFRFLGKPGKISIDRKRRQLWMLALKCRHGFPYRKPHEGYAGSDTEDYDDGLPSHLTPPFSATALSVLPVIFLAIPRLSRMSLVPLPHVCSEAGTVFGRATVALSPFTRAKSAIPVLVAVFGKYMAAHTHFGFSVLGATAVFLSGHSLKMIWIAARFDPTKVIDRQTVGDRPYMQSVSKPVDAPALALNLGLSVAFFIQKLLPNKARRDVSAIFRPTALVDKGYGSPRVHVYGDLNKKGAGPIGGSGPDASAPATGVRPVTFRLARFVNETDRFEAASLPSRVGLLGVCVWRRVCRPLPPSSLWRRHLHLSGCGAICSGLAIPTPGLPGLRKRLCWRMVSPPQRGATATIESGKALRSSSFRTKPTPRIRLRLYAAARLPGDQARPLERTGS